MNKIICIDSPLELPPDYLTCYDVQVDGYYLKSIRVYNKRLDETTLISSLKKTLALFPYLTGRLFFDKMGLPYIKANNAGVLFTTEEKNIPLPNYTNDNPVNFQASNYMHNICKQQRDENTPLLQIKLSQYLNGSILGFTSDHIQLDGFSSGLFMNAWAAIACCEEPPKPIIGRYQLTEMAEGSGEHPDDEMRAVVTASAPVFSEFNGAIQAKTQLPDEKSPKQ